MVLENKLFTEAPEDEETSTVEDTTPPEVEDVPEETEEEVTTDTTEEVVEDDQGPPDIEDDVTEEDIETITSDMPSGEGTEFDKKVSDILNRELYQHYMSLKKTINQELTMLENNIDYINSEVMKETDIVEILKKLEENMDLYLANYFVNSNYSKNVFFYNKCLNMVNLVNLEFKRVLEKLQ